MKRRRSCVWRIRSRQTSVAHLFPTPIGHRDIPREVGEKYGSIVGSPAAGLWWEFPESAWPDFGEELERHGYDVEFWDDDVQF